MKKEQHGFTLLELIVAIVLVGMLPLTAIPTYSGAVQKAQIAQAIGDMGQIELELAKSLTIYPGVLPASLAAVGMDTLNDPWGNPYQYLYIEASANPGVGAVRKDRNLVPLNTDYDLYSMGKDGSSISPLTSTASQDDIVRAGNGAYLGLAEDY